MDYSNEDETHSLLTQTNHLQCFNYHSYLIIFNTEAFVMHKIYQFVLIAISKLTVTTISKSVIGVISIESISLTPCISKIPNPCKN